MQSKNKPSNKKHLNSSFFSDKAKKSFPKSDQRRDPFKLEINLKSTSRNNSVWDSPYKIRLDVKNNHFQNSLDLSLFPKILNKSHPTLSQVVSSHNNDLSLKVSFGRQGTFSTSLNFGISQPRQRFKSFKIQRGNLQYDRVVSDSESGPINLAPSNNQEEESQSSIMISFSSSKVTLKKTEIDKTQTLLSSIKQTEQNRLKLEEYLREIHVHQCIDSLTKKRSAKQFEESDFDADFYKAGVDSVNLFFQNKKNHILEGQQELSFLPTPTMLNIDKYSHINSIRDFTSLCKQRKLRIDTECFVFKWKSIFHGVSFFDDSEDKVPCVVCGVKLSPKSLGGHMSQKHPKKSRKYKLRVQRRNWRNTERKSNKSRKQI